MADALRVLFLCKRHYMGKDVIADRYGRLFHFPAYLASQGHQVTCVVSDYYSPAGAEEELRIADCQWLSRPVRRPLALRRTLHQAAAQADVILGSSDCLQVVLAHRLGRRFNTPVVADLYDNYESFGLARLPLLTRAYRRAVAQADAVTCVGDQLAQWVTTHLAPRGKVLALNSTIAPGEFFPAGQSAARTALGLPEEPLVGVCGGLNANRGIGQVYAAMEQLWAQGASARLVLAGQVDQRVPPPTDERVIFLGALSLAQMNDFYNAMDLNLLQYLDNGFGRYAYPQKLDEVIATGAPLIAANVGELRTRFAQTPDVLYRSDDPVAIAAGIEQGLAAPVHYLAQPQDWNAVGARLDALLRELVSGKAP